MKALTLAAALIALAAPAQAANVSLQCDIVESGYAIEKKSGAKGSSIDSSYVAIIEFTGEGAAVFSSEFYGMPLRLRVVTTNAAYLFEFANKDADTMKFAMSVDRQTGRFTLSRESASEYGVGDFRQLNSFTSGNGTCRAITITPKM